MQRPEVKKHSTPKTQLEKKIYQQQVSLLFSSTNLTNISHSILALLFVFLLWNTTNNSNLLIWFTVMLAIFFIRGFISNVYRRIERNYDETERWVNYYILASALTGLGWGAGSVIFFPENDVTMQYIITFIIVGIGLAVINVLSVMPLAMYSLVIPLILPINIVFLLQANQTSTILGVMILFSIVFLIKSGKNNYRIIYDNIALRLAETQTNEQLKLAMAEANKASQAKSEFLSRMSHELRTPLNAILGFAQLLELDSHSLKQTQKENISEILHAGHHLLNLINEVLDLSKIESGKLQLDISRVNLKLIFQQSINLIRQQSSDAHINIKEHFHEKELYVKADATKLKQVILNLLSNAIKYNRDGGSIIVSCDQTKPQKVTLTISDSGPGLTEQEIKQLFIPFDRLNASDSIEGTGIGLVITRYLVELMGGQLQVESQIGQGSRFIVELESINTLNHDK